MGETVREPREYDRLTVTLRPPLRQQLDKFAKAENRSLSNAIETLIRRALPPCSAGDDAENTSVAVRLTEAA
jgi:hypothetical protein